MGKRFKIGEYCGATLDCGEKCECRDSEPYTYSHAITGDDEMGCEPMNPSVVYILCDADKRNNLIAQYGEKTSGT